MAAYNFQALTKEGKTQQGIIEADGEKQVRQQLRQQGLTPLNVQAVTEKKKLSASFLQFNKKIHSNDLALLTRQLATLIAAGLPLEEALRGVAEQNDKNHIKSIIFGVRSKILEGHSFAAALAYFPQTFSELYRATIAAGEQTGRLDVILNRLADYTEQQQQIRQKIRQALIYPAIMTIVALTIVGFLLAYVVPKIISVLLSNNQSLPLATAILLTISHFIQYYGLYVLLLLVIAGYFFQRFLRNENNRTRWHHFLLSIPVLGTTIKRINSARFTRTFGILFAAGVNVLESMRVAAQLITNLPIRHAVMQAQMRVREGAAIHSTLKQTGYFSALTLHLIASGEASGKLDDMLDRAGKTEDSMVSSTIETTLTLFEPLIILILGSIVLFIVLAILLPIFQLDQIT